MHMKLNALFHRIIHADGGSLGLLNESGGQHKVIIIAVIGHLAANGEIHSVFDLVHHFPIGRLILDIFGNMNRALVVRYAKAQHRRLMLGQLAAVHSENAATDNGFHGFRADGVHAYNFAAGAFAHNHVAAGDGGGRSGAEELLLAALSLRRSLLLGVGLKLGLGIIGVNLY